MPELTIGQVARRAGVPTSTLRFYERIGLLPAPRRRSGQRRYDQAIVQSIQLIQMAKHAGFTIAEIRTLLYEFSADTPPSARWQPLAQRKLHELDLFQARIETMRSVLQQGLNCACARLEECDIEVEQGCRSPAAAPR